MLNSILQLIKKSNILINDYNDLSLLFNFIYCLFKF